MEQLNSEALAIRYSQLRYPLNLGTQNTFVPAKTRNEWPRPVFALGAWRTSMVKRRISA